MACVPPTVTKMLFSVTSNPLSDSFSAITFLNSEIPKLEVYPVNQFFIHIQLPYMKQTSEICFLVPLNTDLRRL
jgi:hypothetical protein